MHKIYSWLATMSAVELENLAHELEFHPDPWAVGARKLVAQELRSDHHAGAMRNKIFTF